MLSFAAPSARIDQERPLHDECARVAVTLDVVGCGAGANFDRHLGAGIKEVEHHARNTLCARRAAGPRR